MHGKRFGLALLGVVLALVVQSTPAHAAGAPAFASAAAAAGVQGHRCGNPSAVSGGVRAGICARLDIWEDGAIFGFGQAFCQRATAPYAEVRCHGVVQGVDVWRRGPNTAWTQIVHSSNIACGSFDTRYTCSTGRNLVGEFAGRTDGPCYYFYAVSRASIAISSSVTVSGARLSSGVYETPGCRA